MRTATVLAISGLLIAASAPNTLATAQRHLDRAEVLAEISSLNESLIAGHSATAVLQAWCAKYKMANPPRIVAKRDHGIDKPVTARQRRLLGVGPDEPIKYRRVQLLCGSHVLSVADNWYVPSRLTLAMNAQLETTRVPFGLVVRPLHPVRRTLSVERIWLPRPRDLTRSGRLLVVPTYLFRHTAIVLDDHYRPLAEVIENYTGESLNHPR